MKAKSAKKKPTKRIRCKGKLVYFTEAELEFLGRRAAADRRDMNSYIRAKCLEGFDG